MPPIPSQGALRSRTPTPRAVGTTVAVKDLFKPLPVRHRVRGRGLACSTWEQCQVSGKRWDGEHHGDGQGPVQAAASAAQGKRGRGSMEALLAYGVSCA